MRIETIERSQCTLGEMGEQYLELHTRFLQNPEVTQFLRIPRPINIEQQRTWLRRVLNSPHDRLFAILKGNADRQDARSFIGLAHLHEIDVSHGTANSGMYIGDTACWSQHIGTEAKLLQLQYAFEVLRLRWVFSRVSASNKRMQ